MGSVTCNRCGFVSFATSAVCKQCGNALVAGPAGAQPGAGSTPGFAGTPYGAGVPYGAGAPYVQPQFAAGRSNGMAVAALLCGLGGIPALVVGVGVGAALGLGVTGAGLLGVLLFGLTSLLGVILGIAAAARARREPAQFGGHGMAVAGIVLACVSFLMIVPVGIIAAIAVPNLIVARRAANEAAALRSVRDIAGAQQDYADQFGDGEYGTLDDLGRARLIDARLSNGTKSGYIFNLDSTGDSYVLTAIPAEYPNSGARSFYYSSAEGVIHAGDKGGRPAGEDDPVVFNSEGTQEITLPTDVEVEEQVRALKARNR